MKTCQNCGAQWPDEQKYCKNCGEKLPDAPEKSVTEPVVDPIAPQPPKREAVYAAAPQPKKVGGKKMTVLIIVVIAAAAAIIGAMFYISNKNQQYAEQLLKGDQYFRQQEYKKAIAAYNKAIAMKKDEPRPYESVARVYFVQENYTRAEKTLSRVDKSKQTGSMQITYANIKRAQGDTASAQTYYNKAVKMLPAQIEDTEDKTERDRLVSMLSNEALPNADDVSGKAVRKAEKTISRYGDESVQMGTTNNNALTVDTVADGYNGLLASQGSAFAVIDDTVYHFYHQKLFESSTDGKAKTLYTSQDKYDVLGNLNVYSGNFYFTRTPLDGEMLEVYKLPVSGGDAEKLCTVNAGTGNENAELIVYKNKLYLSTADWGSVEEGGTLTIASYNLDGSSKKVLTSQDFDTMDQYLSLKFAIDDGTLYAPLNGKGIAIDLSDGSETTFRIRPSSGTPSLSDSFTVSNGKLYGIKYPDDASSGLLDDDTEDQQLQPEVFSCDLKTESAEDIVTAISGYVSSVFVDDGKCYFLTTENAVTDIFKLVDEDGKTISGESDFYRVALIDHVFYIEDGDGNVKTVDLS